MTNLKGKICEEQVIIALKNYLLSQKGSYNWTIWSDNKMLDHKFHIDLLLVNPYLPFGPAAWAIQIKLRGGLKDTRPIINQELIDEFDLDDHQINALVLNIQVDNSLVNNRLNYSITGRSLWNTILNAEGHVDYSIWRKR